VFMGTPANHSPRVGFASINVPAEPIRPDLELPGKQPGPAADSVWQAQSSQAEALAAVASGQFRKVGSASSS
jgi:hypothetical protein